MLVMFSSSRCMYLGRQAALTKIGLDEPQGEHTLRNVSMGAAGAAPFGGLIGERPLIHDPTRNEHIPRMSAEELSTLSQPGDVIISTKPGLSKSKTPISLFEGTPYYHTETVIGKKKGQGVSLTAGELADTPHVSLNKILKTFPPLESDLKGWGYSGTTLLRPRIPLTAEQRATLLADSLQRGQATFNPRRALSTLARRLFIPNIGQTTQTTPAPPGDICSTSSAQSYLAATGKPVLPEVAPKFQVPADFLRSPEYTAIAASGPQLSNSSRQLHKISPYLARAGVGALLAGGVYGISKLLENNKTT